MRQVNQHYSQSRNQQQKVHTSKKRLSILMALCLFTLTACDFGIGELRQMIAPRWDTTNSHIDKGITQMGRGVDVMERGIDKLSDGFYDISQTAKEVGTGLNQNIGEFNDILRGGLKGGLDEPTLAKIQDINNTMGSINATVVRGLKGGLDAETLAQVQQATNVIGEINQTIRQGVGLNAQTLERVDNALRLFERGIEFGPATRSLLNNGIKTMRDSPAAWRATALDIVKALENSTVRSEQLFVADLRQILKQADDDANAILDRVTTTPQCTMDMALNKVAFVNEYVDRSLLGSFEKLLTGQERPTLVPVPWVCHVSPSVIRIADMGTMRVAQEDIIKVIGTNFVPENLPEVMVVDEANQPISTVKLRKPYASSRYEVQLNLQEVDLTAVRAGYRIVFKWPNGGIDSAISILMPDLPTPTPQPTMIPPAPPKPMLVVSLASANGVGSRVYRGPGTEYGWLRRLAVGDSLMVTGRNVAGTWYRVDYQGRLQAWVYAPLVTVTHSEWVPTVQDIEIPAPPAPAPPPILPTVTPAPAVPIAPPPPQPVSYGALCSYKWGQMSNLCADSSVVFVGGSTVVRWRISNFVIGYFDHGDGRGFGSEIYPEMVVTVENIVAPRVVVLRWKDQSGREYFDELTIGVR